MYVCILFHVSRGREKRSGEKSYVCLGTQQLYLSKRDYIWHVVPLPLQTARRQPRHPPVPHAKSTQFKSFKGVYIEKLMVEVGSRCRDLKLFEASSIIDVEESLDRLHYSDDEGGTFRTYKWFEPLFYRALPRLANLQVVQLKHFNCDDQALVQFSIHTKNLVWVDFLVHIL
jgi:hypothetical protein